MNSGEVGQASMLVPNLSGGGNPHCLKCESLQEGFLGRFEWAIAHGEGRCGKCGWPARRYHYLTIPGTTKEGRLILILQYHPDFVQERSNAA